MRPPTSNRYASEWLRLGDGSQHRRECRYRYDRLTDVWSLGITALELAQMAPPHADVEPQVTGRYEITMHRCDTVMTPMRV